jgi:hypothetical protein
MSVKPVKISLLRTIFDVEPRKSAQAVDYLPNTVRDAVLAAMRIQLFYENNKTDMIMARDVAQILRQMQTQKVCTCEMHHAGESQIVASSILWEYELPIVKPDGRLEVVNFFEAGTQRSVLNGYNFQWTLNSYTLLYAILSDPTGVYFAATYGDNQESIGNFLNRMKFKEWTDIPSSLLCVRIHHLEMDKQTHRGVRWFRPDVETVVCAAERVIEMTDSPVQTQKKRHLESPTELVIPEIEFHCEKQFENAVIFYARQILEQRPQTLAELRRTLQNDDISDSFLLNSKGT